MTTKIATKYPPVPSLEWKGYDPDCQVFLFTTTAGDLSAVPLKEMQKVVEFIDKESDKKTN